MHHIALVINDALKPSWSGPNIFSDLVEDAIHICESQNALKGRFVIVLVLRKLAKAQVITKMEVLKLLRTLEAHDGLRLWVRYGWRCVVVVGGRCFGWMD